MREIKNLGSFKKEGKSRSYTYSIFECPTCGKEVEMIRKDGLRAKGCSRSCYTITRSGKRRGGYVQRIFSKGYYLIYMPDHPYATGTKKLYVPEHRLVAEGKIGRFLNRDEIVHHVNGIKSDNRPDNLQVMTASEHNRLHALERRRKMNGTFTEVQSMG